MRTPQHLLDLYPNAYRVDSPTEGLTHLYVLVDPRTEKVRYVGISAFPGSRLGGHLHIRPQPKQCAYTSWLLELKQIRLQPQMYVIASGDAQSMRIKERQLLTHYNQNGDLINPEVLRPKGAIRQSDGRLKANRDRRKHLYNAITEM